MSVRTARLIRFLSYRARTGGRLAIASLIVLFGCETLQSVVAEGDTRTLTFHHTHRGDDLTITFKRNGRYDDEALKKLNYYLRDWRNDDVTNMDPHLFDILWEVYREVDGKDAINIVSSYRSPQTNAMLRRRGHGVARFSQHMLGKAMDFFIPGVALEDIRFAGLRLQRGGVGFYPTSGSPFVHLDTGNIRHWPRMTHDQLAHVFPDGKTVHIPTDGQPLRNYSLALAEIHRRGEHAAGEQVAEAPRRNFLAKLLGIGRQDDEDDAEAQAQPPAPERVASAPPPPPVRQDLAAAVPTPRARPQQRQQRTGEFSLASAPQPTPSEIVNARGIWGGNDAAAEPPPRPKVPIATASLAPAPATAPDNAGAVNGGGQRFGWLRGPQGQAPTAPAQRRPSETAANVKWPDAASQPDTAAQNDRVPTELVLAYAANAGAEPNVRPASYPMGSQRPNALIATKSPPASQTQRSGQRGDDPWLRGIVMAPSVQYSMRVAVFGGTDPRSIRPYMVKPQQSVHMVFSDDPQFGMATEYFSGSAVAFLPTVSFIRTAGIN